MVEAIVVNPQPVDEPVDAMFHVEHRDARWARGFDQYMVGLAARRGAVRVEQPDGRVITAVLICWRPRRGNGSRLWQARVEFENGRRRSVSCADVSPVEEYRG